MKTFEEAMELRLGHGPADSARKMERIKRYDSMIREIANSSLTRSFVIQFANLDAPEGMTEEDYWLSVYLSIFANGVMVGIEMEKAE